jgi:uncharacterized protein YjbI with pentapeptide repeats
VNEDSDAQNSFYGNADIAIQAHSIHGGVHIHHPLERFVMDARIDANERWIAEFYAKSAEQLGSDKALVRLAGLHALERFAQHNVEHRQTVVNLWCTYLRMPYQHPPQAAGDAASGFLQVHHQSRGKLPAADDEQAMNTYRDRMREHEVRLSAQRLVADHLRPGDPDEPVSTFWADIDLDLTGATLLDFTLARCVVRTTTFESAIFIGHTDFTSAVFTGEADFRLASFADPNAIAYFQSTVFTDSAYFMGTTFAASAAFARARFGGAVYFMSSAFTSVADFAMVTFTSAVDFRAADFARSATFICTTFNSTADFYGANFPALHTTFIGASFAQHVPNEVDGFWWPEKLRSASTDPQPDRCDP